MRTDTCEIPVTYLCAWCKINLSALLTEPVMYRGYAVHPPCAQAATAEDQANAADAAAAAVTQELYTIDAYHKVPVPV